MHIHITWPAGEATGYLEETVSAKALMEALPITSTANTWGDEVYFDAGTVCLWVEGKSLALPYGPTPASQGEECRLVTDVNILGAIEGDPRILATIHSGDEVTVEAV
jgi:hypothetical protein